MSVTVETKSPVECKVGLLALPLTKLEEGQRLPARIAAIDKASGGRIQQVIDAGDFKGAKGQAALVRPDGGLAATRILLLGLGDEKKLDATGVRASAGAALRAARRHKATALAIVPPSTRRVRGAAAAQALAEGVVLGAYRFDRYQTSGKKDKEETPGEVKTALLVDKGDARDARSGAKVGVVLAESQNLARDLSNEPPNILPPVALAKAAKTMSKEAGLQVRILEPKELEKLGMGAMLAVGQGSANPSRLIVMEHNAPPKKPKKGAKKRKTICLVGKGVCFDSGGLSLKPSASMTKMKHDMSGGATVVGAMRAVALLNVPLHVVGIVGAVENMPSGTAYRVDDVLTSASGKTIEITNTDAEGRLVLADCLDYAQKNYEPAAIVDLATLTGAVIMALGSWAAAVVGNDESLSKAIVAAGEASGERYWPLPLWDVHTEHMRSKIADLRQTGGREAGTISAAAFLGHFVNDDIPWAHLDIAGVADTAAGTSTHVAGATGFGVRSLLEWLRNGKV
jgi:leucyl aminopeptidase